MAIDESREFKPVSIVLLTVSDSRTLADDTSGDILAERIETAAADPRKLVDTHAELVRLTGEQPTYNFDPGLLGMEIGTLLAAAGEASERGNG